MLRVSGQLDPEAGAVLTAALDPLTAPRPCTPTPAGKRFAGTSSDATATIATTDPATGRDLRPPERRRAEALIEICRRAAAAGGSAPATTKAQIVVTIDHDTLKNAVRGAGHTLDGTVLSPQTVRKLACDASIIPMVLGSKSQPLDVGRTKRLVTPALLAALWARDKGCTFPGCGRPPQWSDAHHVKHWIDGGPTALLNLALLCAYHPPPRSAGDPTWVHGHTTSPPPSPPTTSPGKPERVSPDRRTNRAPVFRARRAGPNSGSSAAGSLPTRELFSASR